MQYISSVSGTVSKTHMVFVLIVFSMYEKEYQAEIIIPMFIVISF